MKKKKLNACKMIEILTKCINFAAENKHKVNEMLVLKTINERKSWHKDNQ